MANNLLKFSATALAGLLVVAFVSGHEFGWPSDRLSESLFTVESAERASLSAAWSPPSKDSTRRGNQQHHHKYQHKKSITVNPKVAAENLLVSSRFGLPSNDNLRLFNDFVLSYDRRLRSPVWVMEHLHPGKLNVHNNVSRKLSKFVEDVELHEYFRASLKDFKGSELSRGHMAPAGNHKLTQDDMDQTFVLSNISPQEQKFNAGGWLLLEEYVRHLAGRSKNLYVVTGPLFLPYKGKDGRMYVQYEVLGDNLVSVPTHYFKVILHETGDANLAMEAFMMPNDDKLTKRIKLDDYRVLIQELDVIERSAGVIFFDKVDRGQVEKPASILSSFRMHDNSKTSQPHSQTD